MKQKLIWALILMVPLAGCVTTTTGDSIVQPDAKEAARLNRDLAINYLRQGKPEQALAKLQKSLREDPQDSSTHRVTGYVYEQLGDNRRAEESYRNAVKYGPEDQAALNQLGVFLCRNGEKKAEALGYFDRALDLPDYQDRYVIFTNAGTCARNFDLIAAEDYLRQALKLNPRFSEALFQMADVSYQSGNYLQARAFLERCMAVSEPVPETLWLGHRIEKALGDAVAADRFGAELLKNFPGSAQARELLEKQREPG